ncbi:MAG: hypothetical protein ACYTG1_13250 [Planctomycetota bacterium]|jgi:hypothetical protein
MGQVALGFRSLIVKLAVFFVLAALLAWALGGTLWPRAHTVETDPIDFGGRQWCWRLAVGGSHPLEVRWALVVQDADGEMHPIDDRLWAEVVPTFVVRDGLFLAGRPHGAVDWRVERVDAGGRAESYSMPDRLAVERQLARLAAGLPLQDRATIEAQRRIVLDPPPADADS